MRNRLLALGMVLVLLLPGNIFAFSEDSLLTGAVPERVRFQVRADGQRISIRNCIRSGRDCSGSGARPGQA